MSWLASSLNVLNGIREKGITKRQLEHSTTDSVFAVAARQGAVQRSATNCCCSSCLAAHCDTHAKMKQFLDPLSICRVRLRKSKVMRSSSQREEEGGRCRGLNAAIRAAVHQTYPLTSVSGSEAAISPASPFHHTRRSQINVCLSLVRVRNGWRGRERHPRCLA